MAAQLENPLEAFQWQRQPKAEQFVRGIVDDFLARVPTAAELARRMKEETGTRFVDWVDHLLLPDTQDIRRQLEETGYAIDRQAQPIADQTFRISSDSDPAAIVGRTHRRFID